MAPEEAAAAGLFDSPRLMDGWRRFGGAFAEQRHGFGCLLRRGCWRTSCEAQCEFEGQANLKAKTLWQEKERRRETRRAYSFGMGAQFRFLEKGKARKGRYLAR